MPSLAKLLLAPVGLAAVADAYYSYIALNPNGNMTAVEAIGHVNPNGGGARNQYGVDFATAGHEWNKQLCQMDSDGDGQTNGFELGDPCCTWDASSGASPQFTTDISQPGNPTSKTSRAPYSCSPGPAPTASASPQPGAPDNTTTIYSAVGAGVGGLVIGAAVGTWFAHRNAKAERKGAKRPSTGPVPEYAEDAFVTLTGDA